MSSPTAYTDFDEPARDPPEDDCGEFVCARRCRDGTRCIAQVSLPYLSCYQHDRSDPILRGETESDSIREVDRATQSDG